MWVWRETLFAFLQRNAERSAAFFGVPTRQVVEFGTEIEIWDTLPSSWAGDRIAEQGHVPRRLQVQGMSQAVQRHCRERSKIPLCKWLLARISCTTATRRA